jgi:hypothetical protein
MSRGHGRENASCHLTAAQDRTAVMMETRTVLTPSGRPDVPTSPKRQGFGCHDANKQYFSLPEVGLLASVRLASLVPSFQLFGLKSSGSHQRGVPMAGPSQLS